jgi:LPXTG-motif cell wall-anchored protein
MERIAWLLSFSLILLGALQGVAAAQLSGDSDPLDKVKKPVNDVTNEVEDSGDNVVEDSGEVAEDTGGTAGSVADKTTEAGTTSSDISTPGSSASRTKSTRSGKRSGTGSKDASGAEPSDTDTVAAAGNTIGSAPKNDEQLAAPEADADESEGSILSSTGAQILAWLVLAGLLIATGAALVRRRSRA